MKRSQYWLDFIFTSRLKNYTNIHVCTPLYPSYKTTKITLALDFSATQLPLDKEAESQKDHIFSDMKRLRNHTLISCKGYLEDYLKLYLS